jgi:hypothetical protein
MSAFCAIVIDYPGSNYRIRLGLCFSEQGDKKEHAKYISQLHIFFDV